jgi:CRISPR-associated protein Cas5h
MDALKFRLKGKTAFFKKPDVNTYCYFTYGNVHKIAILGILGSILGFKGYANQNGEVYPEFYDKLKDIKVAIKPISENGFFNKSFQTFNNSVGYASKEKGGNLIVKEQWLEDPCWDIYVTAEKNIYFKKLTDYMLNRKCVFIPYLGKNEHLADISNVEYIEHLEKVEQYKRINSLVASRVLELTKEDDLFNPDTETKWKYEESLPIALDAETNQYVLERFTLTNNNILKLEGLDIYKCKESILYFI